MFVEALGQFSKHQLGGIAVDAPDVACPVPCAYLVQLLSPLALAIMLNPAALICRMELGGLFSPVLVKWLSTSRTFVDRIPSTVDAFIPREQGRPSLRLFLNYHINLLCRLWRE